MDQPNRGYEKKTGVHNQQPGQMQSTQENNYEQQSSTYKDPRAQAGSELINYRFSSEEMRVIHECEVEALYNRAFPVGLGMGLAAFFGVQKGYLKPNSRYGAVPKIIASALFGYIAGRLSYQSVCVEKLMKLPNSKFAELVRKSNKKYADPERRSFYENFTPASDAGVATALSLAPFQAATDSYSDPFQQPDALNLDTTRPNYNGIDDNFTPSMEGTNNLDDDLNIPPPKQVVTYDELRKKNREEYERSRYRPGFGAPSPSQQQQPPQQSFSERSPLQKRDDAERLFPTGPKNRYGDSWSQ